MTDALEDHKGTVSSGGRRSTNLRFADDIDGLAGEEEEMANLVERLDKGSTAYGMEISAEKTKLMTNNASCLLYTSPSPRDRTTSRMPSSSTAS